MADNDINHLCPALRAIYLNWLSQCHSAGLLAHSIVTWRSAEDQNRAKASGLSNAHAGESPHNCTDPDGNPASRAFDFGVFEADGSYVMDGDDPRYAKAAAIGTALGLVSGNTFHKPDSDHLELPNWRVA